MPLYSWSGWYLISRRFDDYRSGSSPLRAAAIDYYGLVWFIYSYFHKFWSGIHFHFEGLFLWLTWLYFVVQGVFFLLLQSNTFLFINSIAKLLLCFRNVKKERNGWKENVQMTGPCKYHSHLDMIIFSIIRSLNHMIEVSFLRVRISSLDNSLPCWW